MKLIFIRQCFSCPDLEWLAFLHCRQSTSQGAQDDRQSLRFLIKSVTVCNKPSLTWELLLKVEDSLLMGSYWCKLRQKRFAASAVYSSDLCVFLSGVKVVKEVVTMWMTVLENTPTTLWEFKNFLRKFINTLNQPLLADSLMRRI